MAPYSDITEPAIAALVDRFYTKARRDRLIGPVFNEAIEDWDEHLRKLCDFWSSVMLTTGRYKGNPMAAHMKLPIQPHFFERWLALWQETAGEVFAPEPAAAFRDKANRIAESLKLALFYRPGELLGPSPSPRKERATNGGIGSKHAPVTPTKTGSRATAPPALDSRLRGNGDSI